MGGLTKYEKQQESSKKTAKNVLLILLVIEGIGLAPGVILGNLWLCPWAWNNPVLMLLGRIFPIITFAGVLAAYNGFPVGKYMTVGVYGFNVFRIAVNAVGFFSDIPNLKGILVFLAVTHVISFLYYFAMTVFLAGSENIRNYMYGKLYR